MKISSSSSGCGQAFLGAFGGGFVGMGLVSWLAPMPNADPDTAAFGALFDGCLPGAALGVIAALLIAAAKRRKDK